MAYVKKMSSTIFGNEPYKFEKKDAGEN